jgi:hypothetical protein
VGENPYFIKGHVRFGSKGRAKKKINKELKWERWIFRGKYSNIKQ